MLPVMAHRAYLLKPDTKEKSVADFSIHRALQVSTGTLRKPCVKKQACLPGSWGPQSFSGELVPAVPASTF